MSRTPKGKKPIPVGPNQPSLFSYFKVTPKVPTTDEKKENLGSSSLKRARVPSDDDDVRDVTPKTPKSVKKRRVITSDDEDEDFNIDDHEEMSSRPQTPTKKAPLKSSASSRGFTTPKSVRVTTAKTAKSPARVKEIRGNLNDKENDVDFVHLSFPFLKPENIRDANKRRPDHPDYDPKTLFVPEDFIKEQSPGHRQWWRLKAANFDTVLFFKVGKFYELYHMDAVIAVEKLGISYMRGKFAHSGFPEIGYAKFAEGLIAKGYNVARVEQTETPDQLAERAKKEKLKDKVVMRELCRITSVATRGVSVLDTESLETSSADSTFLMALKEEKIREENGLKSRFGICLIDCQIGEFILSEFTDDESFSSLRTFLAHNQPSEYLFEKGHIGSTTAAILSAVLRKTNGHGLSSKKEFFTSDETLKQLFSEKYLGRDVNEWPEVLKKVVNDVEEVIPTPHPDYGLAVSALGAVLWYLKRCLIDVDMVTMKKFSFYSPSTLNFKKDKTNGIEKWKNVKMVLDSYSLNALHLLPPSDPLSKKRAHEKKEAAGRDFSLFHTINRCVTPFGKRELRRWICIPSCDPCVIQSRQEAIKFLASPQGMELEIKGGELLKKVADLEKLFQSIHSLGLKYRSTEHPDGRAHMFEAKRYGARKVKNLILALDGMELILKLLTYYANQVDGDVGIAPLIAECLDERPETLAVDLQHFNALIGNREKALEEGKIIPKPGVDSDYDNSLKAIDDAKSALEEFLKNEKKKLKCSQLRFQGASKTPYLLEVPDELSRSLDHNYELKSKRQGWRRFSTPELDGLISDLDAALKITQEFNNDYTRRVFESFDLRKDRWVSIIRKIATFDCLLSLAKYASQSPIQMCFPEFIYDAEKPVIEIHGGYHPTLATGLFQLGQNVSEFIPNDVALGGDNPALLLLTGANMGGKSTLMRQIAVLSVLAQLGSMVPARKMRISPVDRIFCRIGASDCLTAGQSTFYMELNETNIILRSASPHSLAIVDELGRGTSTHDGTAIAGAVLRYMADHVGCRSIFSTHYHSLCQIAAENPRIAEGHMACLVEKDANCDDPCMDNITFLYQLTEGSSSKSYGFFTAKMAGLKPDLIKKADHASKAILNEALTVEKLKSLKLDVQNGISDEMLMEKIGVVY
uniref:DNA mismatch repair protein n=1 Tax=Bursaphelenchus xylophilus TaxID=6326 RepID=A0A1I7RY21_BURXY